MRRVPDPDSPRWAHMSLYLSAKDERGGTWLEDYKFLAAYKLKNTVSSSVCGEVLLEHMGPLCRMLWSSSPSIGQWFLN